MDLILQKLGNLESDINGIKSDINGIKNELSELKDATARIEAKQQIIFDHTAKLSEYHTELKHEMEEIKDHLRFNTYKITENEREIFKLRFGDD